MYAGRADFTLPFVTWEGIEARLRGKPFRTFRPSDFGVPNRYSALIFSSDRYLADQDDVARRFVAVTQRGFQWAADHPREGADILIARNASFLKEPRLVHESAELLARRYYRDGQGRVGTQSAAQWQELTDLPVQGRRPRRPNREAAGRAPGCLGHVHHRPDRRPTAS